MGTVTTRRFASRLPLAPTCTALALLGLASLAGCAEERSAPFSSGAAVTQTETPAPSSSEDPSPAPTSEDAGTSPAPNEDAAPANAAPVCAATIKVTDYFTGSPVTGATATVDGAQTAFSGTLCVASLATGLHPVVIAATGYATYNGAIQLPGGQTSRTVGLFPVTATMASWLALVNSDRSANGAAPVALDNGLTIAAWDHAVDMGTLGYFAHFDTNGFAPTTRSLMLGSMVMGSENIASGYATFQDADAAFMAEQASLPNQSPSDCAADDSLAGHYCNIVASTHNWVGLAAANVGASGLYYDQEFGDLYAYYDTTVSSPEPSAGAAVSLTMLPASGQTFSSEYIQTMPAPTPISTATLNADPTCASSCPSGDAWYPSGSDFVGGNGPAPFAPSLAAGQIVFLALDTNVAAFVGAGGYAAFWPGGTVLPNSYGASSQPMLVP